MSPKTNYADFSAWLHRLQERALQGEEEAVQLYLQTLERYNPSYTRIVGRGHVPDSRHLLQLTIRERDFEAYESSHSH